MKVNAIPGAHRDVDLTPVSWHMPHRGQLERYVDIIREHFGDLVEFTIGLHRVTVKLQAVAEFPHQHVAARQQACRGRLFAQWQQDSREEELEKDLLEDFRNDFLGKNGIEATT